MPCIFTINFEHVYNVYPVNDLTHLSGKQKDEAFNFKHAINFNRHIDISEKNTKIALDLFTGSKSSQIMVKTT